ncbi:MAG: phosphoglycerate dehydrogenase [Alphaproteobacteria bacterium]|nr:MAG: phosphoglycerate dehydrogenase [Alphaproteobacteria bacterium]
MPKVLISDKLSPRAEKIFRDRGIDVDVKTGLDKEELIKIIGDYDGLAVRSATKATAEVIDAATNLKVIGRAGIGVDNIDIPAASAKGIVVMNTPFGNSITTAEHAIAMMFAIARKIPQANETTHQGKWLKSAYMGVELTGKTLGIIGCGNIGSIVANRAQGLKMKVMAFDPFLTPERAVEIGVSKVELDELFAKADFISLHTPLTDKTRHIIDGDALGKMKKGVYIINCARGGLIVESALKLALESGHVAGAALDVFEKEPATENDLFGMENLVATPHLGASTEEAQENVALQVAEQMAEYLLTGAVTNALNMPSVTAEEGPILKPYIELVEKLGLFGGQIAETGINEIRIEYEGAVAELNTKPLTAAAIVGVLKPSLQEINMVSAPTLAKDRGIVVSETKRTQQGVYESYVRITLVTQRQERSVAGTIFSDGKSRLIQVKGINVEAEFGDHILYVENDDKPGFIGKLGTLMGDQDINIATFNLGRSAAGGQAVALVEVDGDIDSAFLAQVRALPQVVVAKALKF